MLVGLVGAAWLTSGCGSSEVDEDNYGFLAESISAPLGEVLPAASVEDKALFHEGRALAMRRFTRAEGLGPAFNVTFCAGCHEKPVFGGGAGLYRNFFLVGKTDGDDFTFVDSAGPSKGVLRAYYYGQEEDARPTWDEDANVIAQRNPVPFFGVGLLVELEDEEIMHHADPDDRDGDGISGRVNIVAGRVGRFGRKAQTATLEGFVRGPMFNHLGLTSDPLSFEQRRRLPMQPPGVERFEAAAKVAALLQPVAQAVLNDEDSRVDDDDVPDPELSREELFKLVSFAMLLAAPEMETLSQQGEQGQELFSATGCASCHTPRLKGPRGKLPVFSDLLVHDMGDQLADGLVMGQARGNEFRTQPLWGVAAVGPYLHDGRASTLDEAIVLHGGESRRARDAYLALSESERAALIEFLLSLGGRSQLTAGLLPPDAPLEAPGNYGAPAAQMPTSERGRFLAGRALFDRDFGFAHGTGGPGFNGDACRGCHFEPTIGGAGPRGVNVMRHGSLDATGAFVAPFIGTMLHKSTSTIGRAVRADESTSIFEHRQTPALYGLGALERIPVELLLAQEDPEDEDANGISGRAHRLPDGRIGRFGWKAQVPTLAEFARDAASAEMGLSLPERAGFTFGMVEDDDPIADPEVTLQEMDLLAFYMLQLGPPPRKSPRDAQQADRGKGLFAAVGCGSCHTPSLGGVPAYSDLLLHDIMPEGAAGVVDGQASMTEFRTPPLWGLSDTAPYGHSGEHDTVDQVIRAHAGEGRMAREGYDALSETDRAALLAFLATL